MAEETEILDNAELQAGDQESQGGKQEKSGSKGGRAQRRTLGFTDYLFGDFISLNFLRRNIAFILLIVVLGLIYIANGYSSQQEILEVNRLKSQVEDAKYNALTRSGELLERSRQSHIEEYLRQKGDSTLTTATTPPYIIKVDTTE